MVGSFWQDYRLDGKERLFPHRKCCVGLTPCISEFRIQFILGFSGLKFGIVFTHLWQQKSILFSLFSSMSNVGSFLVVKYMGTLFWWLFRKWIKNSKLFFLLLGVFLSNLWKNKIVPCVGLGCHRLLEGSIT